MRLSKRIKENNYFSKMNISSDLLFDSLTRVVNRKYMSNYLNYLVEKGIPFSMAILDVDNFKLYNDSYGHMIGDKILVSVAEVLNESSPDNCIIGRYGGDEFILVFEGEDSYDVEWKNIKQIFTSIRQPMNIDILSINLTCTAGAASFPKDGETLDEIFLKADRTLYRGKMKGRNCFIIYVEEKHKDLRYAKEDTLVTKMDKLYKYFELDDDIYFEMYEALSFIVSELNVDCAALYEKNKAPLIYRLKKEHNITRIDDDSVENEYSGNMIIINDRSNVERNSRIRSFMEDNNFRSLLGAKIIAKGKYLGCIMLFQEHIRIWQQEDVSLLKYFSTIAGLSLINNDGE